MERRVPRLQQQLADHRGRRVVLLSHCVLNQNVRYLGGAGPAAGFREVVGDFLGQGVAIHQMPCPEVRTWGGVLKRPVLLAYGAGGTFRGPLIRWLLGPFIWYTRLRYASLAREVVRDVTDYRRSGIEVVGVVGVAGSPSCGVCTTLDLRGSVGALSRCPLADLDLRRLNEDVIAHHVVAGQGLFMQALRRRLTVVGAPVPFLELDPLANPTPRADTLRLRGV